MWADLPSPKPAAVTAVLLLAWLFAYLPGRGDRGQPSASSVVVTSSPAPVAARLNCTSLGQLTGLEWLASGWTKAVYRGRAEDGREVAVKTVNLEGHDIESCLSMSSFSRCYTRTSAKILRELVLLQQLSHPNLIKVVGSCIPDSVGPVLIATELGEPLSSVALLQLSWEERLKVALSVASLLRYLAHSPLGSLGAADFKRQQFVLVGGVLKLADVHDLAVSEPSCSTGADCSAGLSSDESVTCVSGRCRGHNERSNILKAGQDLVFHILPHVAPDGLQNIVEKILAAYKGLLKWDSAKILEETERLAEASR